MGTKIKAVVAAVVLTGAMLVSAPAAQAAPLSLSAIAAASDCPWWVGNGYWKVIWYWGTGQCAPINWWRN